MSQFSGLSCGNPVSIEIDGLTVTARVEVDEDHGAPWDEEDGHGPVSEWTNRDKRPGELVLNEDRGSKRYYDMQEAVKIARRDGWDAPPYGGKPGEKAARAARRDYELLRRWCNNEWFYWVVILSVAKNGITLDDHAACVGGVGVDDDESYLAECAEDMLSEAVDRGQALLETLCDCK